MAQGKERWTFTNTRNVLTFLAIGVAALVASFIVGIADNPPGLLLLYGGCISIIISDQQLSALWHLRQHPGANIEEATNPSRINEYIDVEQRIQDIHKEYQACEKAERLFVRL